MAFLAASSYGDDYTGMKGKEKKEFDSATAYELANILDAYNNGDIGPGHCE